MTVWVETHEVEDHGDDVSSEGDDAGAVQNELDGEAGTAVANGINTRNVLKEAGRDLIVEVKIDPRPLR